jgi:HEPN domain-containing protein
MNRFKDWFNQAKEDLEAAMDSAQSKHFEWACFQAQQSAEKALKSLLLSLNIDSWGHGLFHLFKRYIKTIAANNIKEKNNEEDSTDDDYKALEKKFNDILEKCKSLDRHYIQPRYPNGFPDGYPAEYYNKKISFKCIENAKSILKFVEKEIEKISSSK